MTTITLDVPDELAPKLKKLNRELPELLSLAVSFYQNDSEGYLSFAGSNVINDVVDFLVSSPSAEEIINYKVSPQLQARLEELLDRNREGKLSPHEQAELSSYQQLNHLLILLKARLRQQIIH